MKFYSNKKAFLFFPCPSIVPHRYWLPICTLTSFLLSYRGMFAFCHSTSLPPEQQATILNVHLLSHGKWKVQCTFCIMTRKCSCLVIFCCMINMRAILQERILPASVCLFPLFFWTTQGKNGHTVLYYLEGKKLSVYTFFQCKFIRNLWFAVSGL